MEVFVLVKRKYLQNNDYINVHRGYSKLGQRFFILFVREKKSIIKIIKASRPQFLWEKF